MKWGTGLIVGGALTFSGTIFGLVLAREKVGPVFGPLTPVGGAVMMAGQVLLGREMRYYTNMTDTSSLRSKRFNSGMGIGQVSEPCWISGYVLHMIHSHYVQDTMIIKVQNIQSGTTLL